MRGKGKGRVWMGDVGKRTGDWREGGWDGGRRQEGAGRSGLGRETRKPWEGDQQDKLTGNEGAS